MLCLNSRVTKYHAVREQLLDRLDVMAAGEQLPPERDLAVSMGVSRMTLRRAIDELVARGAIRRRHGTGVFALGSKFAQGLMATSFSEDMRARGLQPGARTLTFELGPVSARIQRRLEVAPTDDVIQIARLRLADDEPMAVEELYVPSALVPGLEAADLENSSFYSLLGDRYGISLARAVQTVEPTVVDEQEARDLDVPVRTPALQFERSSWGQHGEVIEFVRSVYRGDRYKIRTELTIPGDENGGTP